MIDLLRERLEDVQAQLLDVKSWAEEIKEIQRQDRSTLHYNSESLSETGQKTQYCYISKVNDSDSSNLQLCLSLT